MKQKMVSWVNSVNEAIDKFLPVIEDPQKNIYEAMRYSLKAGGKRIRPVLMYAAGEIFDVSKDELEPFAVAVEMIHTYSLIHDDLPAMDNDDMRRGMPTCHIKFNEALAILAGDALLNKAFEIMTEAAVCMQDHLKGLKMMRVVAEAAGTSGMIGGQVVDLESEENLSVTEDVLKHMYACKTGALILAPILVSVEAAGVSGTKDAEMLVKYAQTIGFAFQIKDDILDVTGDLSLLGKNTGSDVRDHKTTYVTLFGIEYCNSFLKDLIADALACANYFGERGAFLKELALFFFERDH